MYIRQKYINKIIPFIDKPLIKVIAGMRRTGKSTIMKQLINYLIEHETTEEQIIYINMESMGNREYSDPEVLYNYVKEKASSPELKMYLFLDEIQEITSWEKVVNSFLADNMADIYITGSNSCLLSGELATFLTGRYIKFDVFPLVYGEFIGIRNGIGDDEQFAAFLRYGGMPGLHHLEFKEEQIYQYLSAIRDSLVLKDVIQRHRIRNTALLEKIILFLFDNVGNIFSARKVAGYFKKEMRSVGQETVYNYLAYLEEAFIINKVRRYDLKGKRLLEGSEKYYITDPGLAHAWRGYRDSDINAYLENIVFIELKSRGYNVAIGKTGEYEIDFIADKNQEVIYIQVCYLLASEEVRERELRPFFKISDNHPKILLSMDKLPASNEEGIIRQYLPDWLIGKGF